MRSHERLSKSLNHQVLADRIRFTPDRARRRYTLTLPIAFDRVMLAALPELGTGLQETVASPRGTVHILRPEYRLFLPAA
jgi:hypothetical protein